MALMENGAAAEIIAQLEVYDRHFKELRVFLLKKQEKVAGDDLIWLLDALNEEQRLIMRGNSLEAKRLALMSSLGYEGFNSQRLLEICPDEYKGSLKLVISSIEENTRHIKECNEELLSLIEKKLEAGENQLRNSAITGASAITGTNTYGSTGNKRHISSDSGEIIGSG